MTETVYNLEEDEMMIDEIIETDPDEAQHHPIVDGDAYEEEDEFRMADNQYEAQEESKEFDGYDSTFFKKDKPSPTKITPMPDSS